MLRIDDPFLVSRRVASVETQVAGFAIEAGTRVYLNWTSANRDESVFGDPDGYRPEEHAAQNLVYGTGVDVCPGRPLATWNCLSPYRRCSARQPVSNWRRTRSPFERRTRSAAGAGCLCACVEECLARAGLSQRRDKPS